MKNKKRLILRIVVIVLAGAFLGIQLYSWNARSLGGDKMPMPLGFATSVVLSGSMEPVYNRGDLVYVQPVKNISQLKVGDVISYVQNEELVVVTHRIVRIDPEQNRVHTKGETNDTEDPPVHFNNVIGVVKFHIPLLGYVSDWVQNPPGMYITVGVGAVLMILVFMPNPFDKKKKSTVAAVGASSAEGTPAEPLPTEEAK